MAYFRNSTINLLNLHYAIHSIAMTGAGAFLVAYLLEAGLPLPGIFATLAAILIGRFLIRPFIIGLAARYGMRRLIVSGTLLSSVQYPILALIHGAGAPLYALIGLVAIADALYWPSYHAYFARLGDDEHRGHQVSAREAIVALVGVASPLAMGATLVAFGPGVAFGATAVVVAASALPLLHTPDIAIAKSAPGAWRAALPGILLFMGDGFTGGIYMFVWQAALFLALDKSFMAYGGALAIAAIVGAAGGMFLGRDIDAGNGIRAVYVACITVALIILLRAAATFNPALAVFANAVSALGGCLYFPTMMAVVYTLAKAAPCTLRFHVAADAGWDLGGATGLMASAILIWLGAPLWTVLLLGLLGIMSQFVLLRAHYARKLALAPAAASITAIE
jgi:MFS transporter, DHA1 family, inner membrane transport protein